MCHALRGVQDWVTIGDAGLAHEKQSTTFFISATFSDWITVRSQYAF